MKRSSTSMRGAAQVNPAGSQGCGHSFWVLISEEGRTPFLWGWAHDWNDMKRGVGISTCQSDGATGYDILGRPAPPLHAPRPSAFSAQGGGAGLKGNAESKATGTVVKRRAKRGAQLNARPQDGETLSIRGVSHQAGNIVPLRMLPIERIGIPHGVEHLCPSGGCRTRGGGVCIGRCKPT